MDRARGDSRREAYVRFWAGLGTVARSAVFGLAAVGGVPALADAQGTTTTATTLVFNGVTVVDVEHGTLLPARRVVIAGHRIQAVGSPSAVKMPKGARVIDARGKYLIPGLWDMHFHTTASPDLFYPFLLANGVTGIRDAGSPVPLDTLLLWRREVLAGTRVGPPRQILSGQSLADREARARKPCDRAARQKLDTSSPQTCVADSADARHVVDSLKAAGADMIKPRDLSRAMYFVIAAEARRLGIPFGGHAEEETATEVSDSGARIVDHLRLAAGWPGPMGFHALCIDRQTASVARCRPVADRLRHNGTWMVADVFQNKMNYDDPLDFRYSSLRAWFNQRLREFWSGSRLSGNWLRDSAVGVNVDTAGLMQVVQRVDLPILAGTDGGGAELRTPIVWTMAPGFTLQGTLAIYVAEGLSRLHALQTATIDPARTLHGTDSLGTVAPGKLADLVLLDANPLADITNTTAIRAVVANGRYFDRAALDDLLAEGRTKTQAAFTKFLAQFSSDLRTEYAETVAKAQADNQAVLDEARAKIRAGTRMEPKP